MNIEKLNAVMEYLNGLVGQHGGSLEVVSVEGGTVSIRMSGGCQGCAGARATLKAGVEAMLKEHVPGFEALVDVTDHTAGKNPYYRNN